MMSGLSPSCPGPRARLDWWRKYRSCPSTQRPGPALQSLRTRSRTHSWPGARSRGWDWLGVTSSRGYVSVCPRVRAALTILFPLILMKLISPWDSLATGLIQFPCIHNKLLLVWCEEPWVISELSQLSLFFIHLSGGPGQSGSAGLDCEYCETRVSRDDDQQTLDTIRQYLNNALVCVSRHH